VHAGKGKEGRYKITQARQKQSKKFPDLLKRAEEFQCKKAHFSGRLLPQDPRAIGGVSLGTKLKRQEPERDGQVDCLIGPKNVC